MNLTDIVKLLLSNLNVDVNIKSIKSEKNKIVSEKAPLYMAVKNKDLEIVQLLLSNQNIDVNIQSSELFDKSIKTPLYLAIENEDIEIVKLLLSNPNIDANNNY